MINNPKFIEENIRLEQFTTIRLGGVARYFARCNDAKQIIQALEFANQKNLPVQVLGGGSNIIFPDAGFNGLIINPQIKSLEVTIQGTVTAGAGLNWDELVTHTLSHGLGGLEVLSGIPGHVGAVPVQNVGAYGLEVSRLITHIAAIERKTGAAVSFTNAQCDFRYRASRFKNRDRDQYIITQVSFQLYDNHHTSALHYPPLREYLSASLPLSPGPAGWWIVRGAVLDLRRRKSMVIDHQDPHTRSCGSFFINPLFTPAELVTFQARVARHQLPEPPTFPTRRLTKVPAAWIIEHAGFPKGFRSGKVGISANHNLALVNYGGTTAELLTFAQKIQAAVKSRFAINLVIEPEIIP